MIGRLGFLLTAGIVAAPAARAFYDFLAPLLVHGGWQ
jgi:hypothetical protein